MIYLSFSRITSSFSQMYMYIKGGKMSDWGGGGGGGGLNGYTASK